MNKTSEMIKLGLKTALIGGGLAIAFMAAPANAGAIDSLKTETAKMEDVVDDVQPIAVSVAVFSFGMMMVKKMVFS